MAGEDQMLLEEVKADGFSIDTPKKPQNLADSLLILNPKENKDGKSKEKLYINPQEKVFKFQDKTGYWDISDNFKEVLRKEVVEYIVKAFDVLFELHRREFEDKLISKRTMVNLKPHESELNNNKTKNTGCWNYIFGDFFTKADENAENFEFDQKTDRAVYGHPDMMKRVDLLTIDDIENDAELEKVYQIFRNESYIVEISEIAEKDYSNTYELIELSPTLFQNIRRMWKITNGAIRKVFSLRNLRRLQISVTQGKGGSFFIRPASGHGKVLLKSITIPEYNTIKKFMPQYYSHLLMNPNSLLVPILGVYKMKMQKTSELAPIAFILMRDNLDLSRYEIGPHDRMFTFDLKGSLNDRQVLSDPTDIFKLDADYDDYKDIVFKDIDFMQSFKKLDITNLQAERIISQLKTDIELLHDNSFMDYSLLMHVIIRPYTSVKAPADLVISRENQLFSDNLYPVEEESEYNEEDLLRSDSNQTKKTDDAQPEPSENRFNSNEKSRMSSNDSRKSDNRNTDLGKSPTYYNRATGKNELLHLYSGSDDEKYNSDNSPRNSKTKAAPLKDLAYYANKKKVSQFTRKKDKPIDKTQNESTLYISESNVGEVSKQKSKNSHNFSPSYDGSLLILKEKLFKKLKVFHIWENSDISTLKGIEAIEKVKGHDVDYRLSQTHQDDICLNEYEEKEDEEEKEKSQKSGLQNEEGKNGKDDAQNLTLQLESIISVESDENSKKLSENQNVMSDLSQNPALDINPNKNPYYRLSSVVNFTKQAKHLQADRGIAGVLSDMTEPNFSRSKTSRENLEKKLQDIDRKIQWEFWAANYQHNHILEIDGMFDDEDTQSRVRNEEDHWKGIVPREKIEQIIFDPQLGMIKREIYFGIIDYVTTFNLKKRIEEKLRIMLNAQPTSVDPDMYAARFLEFTRNIFK